MTLHVAQRHGQCVYAEFVLFASLAVVAGTGFVGQQHTAGGCRVRRSPPTKIQNVSLNSSRSSEKRWDTTVHRPMSHLTLSTSGLYPSVFNYFSETEIRIDAYHAARLSISRSVSGLAITLIISPWRLPLRKFLSCSTR